MIQDSEEKIKHSILSSFADKISSIIDVVKLQQDLDKVYFWTEKTKLNGEKFEHVSFRKDKESVAQSNYFSNTNIQIKTKESVKDLIILCSDMTYKNHIKIISVWIIQNNQIERCKSYADLLEVPSYSIPGLLLTTMVTFSTSSDDKI